MKAVDPIPHQPSEQTKNNDAKSDTMRNKQSAKSPNAQNKEDYKQQTEDTSENIIRTVNLHNQEVFGSLVSLNEYTSNANREQ